MRFAPAVSGQRTHGPGSKTKYTAVLSTFTFSFLLRNDRLPRQAQDKKRKKRLNLDCKSERQTRDVAVRVFLVVVTCGSTETYRDETGRRTVVREGE